MPMSSAPGQNPGPSREAGAEESQTAPTPEEISQAAGEAVDAAVSQRQQEARKVAM